MIQKSFITIVCFVLIFMTAHADAPDKLQNWRIQAEHGNAVAQNKLGIHYELGLGITQDEAAAVKWYRLAAEQGLAEAQFNLAEMYEEGRGGLILDKATARTWYEKACNNGWSCACKKYRELTDKGY
ncbi:MAG: sel1 repeat family protein [Chlorobium sp.]|nr:MAG: sel1 repeat family protein [Chlorobium sp.]